MAELIIGLYKTECVKLDGPFRTVEELELATPSWVHWYNDNNSTRRSTTSHPSSTNRPTTVRSTPGRTRGRDNPLVFPGFRGVA
jgi:hypothetical protein